jgi:hypothetical protein
LFSTKSLPGDYTHRLTGYTSTDAWDERTTVTKLYSARQGLGQAEKQIEKRDIEQKKAEFEKLLMG